MLRSYTAQTLLRVGKNLKIAFLAGVNSVFILLIVLFRNGVKKKL
jgi:hypothetical protein